MVLYPGLEPCLILKKYMSMLEHCKIMGICLQMVCKKELCALECRKLCAKCEKNQNFILLFFIHLDGKKCLHKLNSSVL